MAAWTSANVMGRGSSFSVLDMALVAALVGSEGKTGFVCGILEVVTWSYKVHLI